MAIQPFLGMHDSGILPVNARLPVSTHPFISLLEVKDKCFYITVKIIFTGISVFVVKTVNNRYELYILMTREF